LDSCGIGVRVAAACIRAWAASRRCCSLNIGRPHSIGGIGSRASSAPSLVWGYH
jgi:hypothetical protein